MPDFFGDEYYETARNALRRVDGMALSDLLAGRVFNVLFRKVFAAELEPRSHDMVDDVRAYTQGILQKLFEGACKAYPALLNEVKTSLVEEFMDLKAEQTADAVSNVVKAELGWVFTQDRAYTTTIANVRDMVRKVRLSEAASKATTADGVESLPDSATAVGDVPEAFIKKMIASTKAKDQDIRNLQVCIIGPPPCLRSHHHTVLSPGCLTIMLLCVFFVAKQAQNVPKVYFLHGHYVVVVIFRKTIS